MPLSRGELLLPARGEKVGMREPIRWAETSGNAPSPSFASLARALPASGER